MNQFKLITTPAFEKDFAKLPEPAIKNLIPRLLNLEKNPFTGGDIKKIRMSKEADYRLRIGDYRIIFRLESQNIYLLRIIQKKDFEKILREILG